MAAIKLAKPGRSKSSRAFFGVLLFFSLMVFYNVFLTDRHNVSNDNERLANFPSGGGRLAVEDIQLRLQRPPHQRGSFEKYVITFVGDTMFHNVAYNFETETYGEEGWRIGQGLDNVKHLLTGDYLVMNLEGPITALPISVDVRPRKISNPFFSFGMDPRVTDIIKELGVDAVNLANNHIADRNVEGFLETKEHLERVGIDYFGAGWDEETQATPLIIDTPQGKVGVTGFMESRYCCDELPREGAKRGPPQSDRPMGKYNSSDLVHVTLRPTQPSADLAIKLLGKKGAKIKVAFAHWINNYVTDIKNVTRDCAETLANAGYDFILGSAGSHTVKPIEFLSSKEIPIFYDIGNFVFMKPNRFKKHDSMPYGTVTHLILEKGEMAKLEIHCIMVENDVVMYRPRPCTKAEATELFSNLGPFVQHEEGKLYATVDFRSKRSITSTA